MNTTLAILLLILGAAFAGAAQAVPPGVTVEFRPENAEPVIFSGTTHGEAGLRCAQCHLSIFDVSRAARFTRADHRTNQFCFGCHNGEKAFAARGHCESCHVDSP